jgi:hypothetical protein
LIWISPPPVFVACQCDGSQCEDIIIDDSPTALASLAISIAKYDRSQKLAERDWLMKSRSAQRPLMQINEA